MVMVVMVMLVIVVVVVVKGLQDSTYAPCAL